LADPLLPNLRRNTREQVGRACRSERNDHCDGLGRVILCDAGMIAANKTRKGHSSYRGVMVPPVDLASGDQHAPVKPPAARWSAVAPLQRSGWKRPSVWLVRATIETLQPPAGGTGTLTERRGPSKKRDRSQRMTRQIASLRLDRAQACRQQKRSSKRDYR